MNKLQIIFLITITLALYHGFGDTASAQEKVCCENVSVHFDKEIYVAGDAVHFKAYLIREGKPQKSILYLSLSGNNHPGELNWRINMHNNMACGFFRLPPDLPEGTYEVKAYTNTMQNNGPETYFSGSILVLNLAKTTGDSLCIPETAASSFSTSTSNKDIGVTIPDHTIVGGENMELQITNNATDSAFLSFSVIRETPLASVFHNSEVNVTSVQKKQSSLMEECEYGNESKGFRLSGTLIQSETGEPLEGAKILLAVSDSNYPALLFAMCDHNGRFCFYLSEYYDNRDLILQVADTAITGKLSWIIDKKNRDVPLQNTVQKLDKTQKDYLNRLKDLRVIEAVYNKSKDTASMFMKRKPADIYFGYPDQVIRPSEYVELVNFNEIDDNILPLSNFSIRNQKHYLAVFNMLQQNWSEDALVLLNGVPFYDLDYISLLGTSQIKRIDVFTSGIILGGVSFDGAIGIYTFDHVIPDSYLEQTFIYHNEVVPQGYRTINENVTSGRLPDFRDNLIFEPDIRMGKGETYHIEFPVSLLEGKYQITIMGITASGSPVNISEQLIIQMADE